MLVPLQLSLTDETVMNLEHSPACDWLTLRHDYPVDSPAKPYESGRVIKVSREGEIDWESQSWDSIRCPSSDTSIRVKCDGKHLWASANIGRFQRSDNFQGFTVLQCVEKWMDVLGNLGFDLRGFGTRNRVGTLAEWGTHLTRIDLCANFETSDYSALTQGAMVRRLNQCLPQLGRYGPMWGYDRKRSNWWKAKLYDKSAEMTGKRRSDGGATNARFEVSLYSEFLKRNGLDRVAAWGGKDGDDMGKVIYGRFAEQLFRESFEVQRWDELPSRLHHWATCWREGRDIRADVSRATYFRIRKQLLEYGIDIGAPCNVLALTRHVRVVEVRSLPNLIEAA